MPRKKNLYTNYFYINYYIQVSKNLNDKSSKKKWYKNHFEETSRDVNIFFFFFWCNIIS